MDIWINNFFKFWRRICKLSRKKEIAILTISNPDNSNSLNLFILDELEKGLNSFYNSKIKAFIITGEGDKSFVDDLDESSERFSKTWKYSF